MGDAQTDRRWPRYQPELFAADGTQIAQLYGQRTEGEPEQTQWRAQIDALTPKGLAA